MTAIQNDVPGRPIFVHAQTRDIAAKLDSTPGFSRLFVNPAGGVYAYMPPAAAR